MNISTFEEMYFIACMLFYRKKLRVIRKMDRALVITGQDIIEKHPSCIVMVKGKDERPTFV